MDDRERLALEAATPEARELLEAIFAHNEREAEWSKERLAALAEDERMRAMAARGERITSRLAEILRFLYGAAPGMSYAEEETPYGIEKKLTIHWLNDYLEEVIQA